MKAVVFLMNPNSSFLDRYGQGYKDPFNFQARLPNLYRVPVSTPRDQWDQLWRSIPYLAVDIPPQVRDIFVFIQKIDDKNTTGGRG